ncbi:MAG: transglutaminase domain-containing protein [Candidatus Eisenbacteria bacterium]
MGKRIVRLAAAAALAFPVCAWGAVGDTTAVIGAPGSCPTGLAWHGGALWAADWETGTLYTLDPATGAVKSEIPAPGPHPEGLASSGEILYVADGSTGRIYGFDPERNLVLHSYPSPESAPKGLAFGGGSLWLVDDGANTIYEIVPDDGTILNYFKAPHKLCRGLAHDGKWLWVTDRGNDEIYALEPEDGTPLFLAKAPGPFPVGLAFGDGDLWLTDFQRMKIYRIRADAGGEPFRVTGEVDRDFRFRYVMRNDGEGVVAGASIHIAVPYEELENQKILAPVLWTPDPDEFAEDRWGQRIAVFRFENIPPSGTVSAGYETRVRLGELHYAFDPEKDIDESRSLEGEERAKYLAPTSRLQMDKDLVTSTAREIVGDETNPYRIARKIYDWTRGALEYERVGGWDVPTTLIKRGTGSCSEYAFLYIALCRAAGLPARYEGSVVVRGDDTSIDDVYHRWCEVHIPGVGWMPVDPSGGDQEWPADQVRYFGGLAPRFMITTHGGGDSEYLGWDYNAHAVYTYRGRGTVHEEGYGIWRAVAGEE